MSLTSTIKQHTNWQSGTTYSPSRWRLSPGVETPTPRSPSTAELWRWTLTHDAIAPCFVRDVLNMREHTDTGRETDFFWLGHVPCRTVRIVGLIVGVKTYEKRIVYSVDDGTSVIDCSHRQSPARIPQANGDPGPSPKPVAYVSHSVCIVGNVKRQYETRQILVNNIERCASSNDEPNHWLKVLALHKSSYSLPGPFIIPPTSVQPTSPIKLVLNRPSGQEVPTPSTVCSTPASSVATSPEKSMKSPRKLRHPSRLHSRDLTGNTFQIYMKHFMVHAPRTEVSHESEHEPDSDQLPSTPTKRSRCSVHEETPRASSSRHPESTPRPSIPRLLLGAPPPLPLADPASSVQGFTLSHLRRVPELAGMARRVVKAEAKRRLREERKKTEVASNNAQNHPKSMSTTSQTLDKDKIASKMKRLFKWAIVHLLQDGSIVLWDGPVRACPQMSGSYTSGLWHANATSNSTVGADSTLFSVINEVNHRIDAECDGDMELSDPESNEEAYIPLSPDYLAIHVARAIDALTNIETKKNGEVIKRPPRSTKEGILAYLRKDDRWRYVGEYNVEEALQVLKSDKRAWCVEKGRWELTV